MTDAWLDAVMASARVLEIAILTNPDEGTLKGVVLPLDKKPGKTWTEQCMQKAKLAAEIRTLRVMNGMRVTVWQICVEKRRQYLSSMLGLGSPMVPLPADCGRKILEFLPAINDEYIEYALR